MDIFPTLMNLVGGKLPNVTLDGVDMAPILFDNKEVSNRLTSVTLFQGSSHSQSNRDSYIYYPPGPSPQYGAYAVRWHEYKAHYHTHG